MSHARARWAPVVVAGALAAGGAGVLRRMERDYTEDGSLRPATVTAMYTTYAAFGGVFLWALRNRIWPVPIPQRAAQAFGVPVTAVGAAVCIAGMSLFDSAAQISATETGRLHAGGIYRWSRNPQYLGNGLIVSGAAVARRSGFVGALATAVWLIYRRWIPFEERHLAAHFGDEYTDYGRRVRRWIGRRSPQRTDR